MGCQSAFAELGANLSGANLSHANLIGANWPSANLSGADSGMPILEVPTLDRANLSGARADRAENLEREQLTEIRYYKEFPPHLPEGLTPPNDKEKNFIKKGDLDYNEAELEFLRRRRR